MDYKAEAIKRQGEVAARSGKTLDDNPYRRYWGTKASDVFKAAWWDAGFTNTTRGNHSDNP